jgi:anti-sigma B factor antagonist
MPVTPFDGHAPAKYLACMTQMYEPGEVETAVEQGLSIVRLVGEHDLSTSRVLADRLAELIATGNPLVFDMSEATFVDSTVAHAVENARAALEERGPAVALVLPEVAPSPIPTVLAVTGLSSRIPIFTSTQEARKALPDSVDGH